MKIALLLFLSSLACSAQMFSRTAAFRGAATVPGPAGWTYGATSFDGSTQNMTNLTNLGVSAPTLAQSQKGIFSTWFRLADNTSAVEMMLSSANASIDIRKSSGKNIYVSSADGAGVPQMANYYSVASITDTAWHHLVTSWDLNAGVWKLYVDDTSTASWATDVFNTGNTNAVKTTAWYVGSSPSLANPWKGCLAETYFCLGVYIDLSVAGNRRLFDNGSSKPIDLSLTGAGTLRNTVGIDPQILLHSSSGATWAAGNLGSGGNFSPAGTPTVCGSIP